MSKPFQICLLCYYCRHFQVLQPGFVSVQKILLQISVEWNDKKRNRAFEIEIERTPVTRHPPPATRYPLPVTRYPHPPPATRRLQFGKTVCRLLCLKVTDSFVMFSPTKKLTCFKIWVVVATGAIPFRRR